MLLDQLKLITATAGLSSETEILTTLYYLYQQFFFKISTDKQKDADPVRRPSVVHPHIFKLKDFVLFISFNTSRLLQKEVLPLSKLCPLPSAFHR